MLIAPTAVERWLRRPLRDSARAKKRSRPQIARMYAEAKPPKLKNKLRHHQRVGFLMGLMRRRYLFLYDPGLGKSLMVLALLKHYRRNHPKTRMLVCVPNTSNVGQWCQEIHKQTDLRAVGVDGIGWKERWAQLTDPTADVVIVTYMGLLSLVCNAKRGEKSGNKGKWDIDYKIVRKVAELFPFLCLDEITACANTMAKTTRVVRVMSWHHTTRAVYGLTGTLIGKEPEAAWSQFHVVDGGETLGPTKGLYMAAFFRGKKNYWGGMDWKFDVRKKGLLNRMLRNRSLRFSENECLDLPKVVHMNRIVDFNKETWTYYDRLVEQLREQHKALSVTDSPFHRMRYITAGYLNLKTEAGEHTTIRFKENPKLDALIDDIKEVPPDRKIVVFHHYRTTGAIISEALTKNKIKHIRLWSGTPAKQKRDIAIALAKKGVRVLVSSTAGAFGGNWQDANYVKFFEPPSDPKLRKQMMKRCHRMGQKRTVFVTDYAVRGSIDVRILKEQKRGKDLMDSIVDGTVTWDMMKRR